MTMNPKRQKTRTERINDRLNQVVLVRTRTLVASVVAFGVGFLFGFVVG